jgi:hypothetical protein
MAGSNFPASIQKIASFSCRPPGTVGNQEACPQTAFASTMRGAAAVRTCGKGGRTYGKSTEEGNTPARKDGPAVNRPTRT